MTHQASGLPAQPHLRLTPSQIFDLWQSGHYTPKGYLYHLVLSHKKAGWWWRIDNISEFCRKWDINRRTFYRAKAALIHEGLFEESIIGSIEIRVCSTSVCDSSDTGVSNEGSTVSLESQRVPDLTQSVPTESHMAAETQSQQSFSEAPDLIQIFKQITTTGEKVCVPVENFSSDTEERKNILNDRPRTEVKKPNSQVNSKKIFTPPILQRAKKLGVKVSDRILLEVVQKWPDRVPIALDCLEEKQLTVKHPTRFLQSAIEQDWRPEKSISSPSGFGEWFNEARKRGLAIASEMRGDVLHVFTTDQHWLPFEQLRRMTWDELSARMNPINTSAVDVQAVQMLEA